MKTSISIKSVDKLLLLAFLLGLITTLIFAYTNNWVESTPTDATVANQIDDFNRKLRIDVSDRVKTYIAGFVAGDSNAGFYQVLFIEQASFSTPAANKYVFGGKLIAGKCELVGKDEDGDEIQLSYAGKHMIGSGTTPQAYMYNDTNEDTDGGRESTIRAKGDQSGGETTTLGYIEISHDGSSDDQKGRYRIMLNDGDDSDAPSKCPIEYASDGTIDVTNSVSVLDEDAMGSDSAVKLTTQQSQVAYIATQIATKAFGAYTVQDDNSATMVVAHAYLANQDGFVVVQHTVNGAMDVIGYIDTDTNPASGGTVAGRMKAAIYVSTSDVQTMTFPVASGKYFEITSANGTQSIRWYPIGTLVKCTDQD